MREPLVTVICLCYNHERFLKQAIESVIKQSHASIQIIVWDDASSDNSPTVIRQLAKVYPQLEVTLSEKNEGNCRAFNRAYLQARGEFIVDFSTDDVMHELRLEKQLKHFSLADEDTGVVFTDATYIDEHGAFIRHHYEHLFRYRLINEVAAGNVFSSVLDTYYIASPTMMMRRSVLDRLGGYDEDLAYEDFDLWVRSARMFRYAFLDERLTFIRKSASAMSSTWYEVGDKQLKSTYLVCLKAVELCQSDDERQALIRRVKYEFKHSAVSGNRTEAGLFWKLLNTLSPVDGRDKFWFVINAMRLPLGKLRRLYHWLRYSS
jgi:glycosyltransferase involved in cell wall biosynthesis